MKKFVIGFIALALMVGTTAFALNQKKPATLNQYWYKLNTGGNPSVYTDYSRVALQPCSGSSQIVCGVRAEQFSEDDAEHPNLNQIQTTVYKP